MPTHQINLPVQRVKLMLALAASLSIIHFIESSALVTIILLPFWYFLFRPLKRAEVLIFFIASLFFLGQNYSFLKMGGFSFKHQDILLMPYYEPFLWGFYYLSLKRFIGEPASNTPLQFRGVLGLFMTSLAFSFTFSSLALLLATLTSTIILLIMFHQRYDLYYGGLAFVLGTTVELFGVTAELWSYPHTDFLGLPYTYANMWISVGLLGRRFLIPVAEWLDRKIPLS